MAKVRLSVLVTLTLVAAAVGSPAAQAASTDGAALNMQVVGHNDLGNRGYNADVFVHDGFAYVGNWGFQDWSSGSKNRFCPDDAKAGIQVIDVRVPAAPTVVAKLQNPSNTSAEDVVVFTARYGTLAGRDIGVSGIQTCGSPYDTRLFRGLELWDVTNPAHPVEIGRLDTGCCTRGIHELEVQHRTDLGRTFVYASVPTSEYPDTASPSGRRDQLGRGDFRLIDITNPTQPFEVSNWGVVHDLGGPPAAGLGCDPDPIYGHSAEPSADGKLAFLAYWDSGFIAIDLTDPANPVYRGRTVYLATADGDAHSSSYDEARQLLFTADEDFCKTSGSGTEKGYGYLRVYDYSDLANPVQVGDYRTPHSLDTNDQRAGDYVIHNPLVVGTDVYMSWYSDGVRVVDASNPKALREVAYFVPPQREQPRQPVAAWRTDQHHPGVGRGCRRDDRAGLPQRHELRPLDRAAHGIGGLGRAPGQLGRARSPASVGRGRSEPPSPTHVSPQPPRLVERELGGLWVEVVQPERARDDRRAEVPVDQASGDV